MIGRIACWAGVLAAGLLIGSCGSDLGGPEELPELDLGLLRAEVQPLFDRTCAQASCHGRVQRPFRLFSREGLRLPGHEGDKALAEEELLANLNMSRGFLLGFEDRPERSLLLRKPLPISAGGLKHLGKDPFFDRTDPSYLLLACWLSGGGLPGGPECLP